MVQDERRLYGATGEIGKDGLLTPDQRLLLNRIQERATTTVFSYLDSRNPGEPSPLVAMATGIGKGNIIHRAIETQMRRKPDSRVLVIAGTKNVLVHQTHEALQKYQTTQVFPEVEDEYVESEDVEEEGLDTEETDEYTPEQSFLYKTGKLNNPDVNVHVATIQSVQSAKKRERLNPKEYDLVIVDEAHNVGTKDRKETVNSFDRVMGLTATPFRHFGQMKAPEQYGFQIVESLSLPEAQELRLLPPLVGIQVDTKEVVDEIPMTKTGKIDYRKLEKLLKKSPKLRPFIADRVAKIISSEGRNYKTVMAVNYVWEAQELAELLKAKGIKVGVAVNEQAAKEIHSDDIPAIDSLERYALPDEDENSIQVLISPYVASEGFDAPFTEALVWASPTDSSLRYTQYTGRLARRAEGKRFGVVVDCLYQTDQYNWSYNMGMWMKGDVKQLDNGLLWLGPETDIEGLNALSPIQSLKKEGDVFSLEKLQKEGLLELQEEDYPLRNSDLSEIFVGSANKLGKIAREVLALIENERPGFTIKRRSNNMTVNVIKQEDKSLFIQRMLENKVLLRETELPPVREGDFLVVQSTMKDLFYGETNKVGRLGKVVLEEVIKNRPEITAQRTYKGQVVTVIIDKEAFIKQVLERGGKLKPQIPMLADTDFPISNNSLTSVFIGAASNLLPFALQALENIKEVRPEIIVKRKNGSRIVDAVSDRDLFINEMRRLGVTLKSDVVQNLNENDFSLNSQNIVANFKGDSKKVRIIARRIVEEMERNCPETITEKKSGGHTVKVILDLDLFFQEMLQAGIEPRDKRS